MRRAKEISRILAISVAAAMIAGCGGQTGGNDKTADSGKETAEDSNGTETSGNQEKEDPGKEIEITWMHKFVEPGILTWVDEVIGNFEKANPGIKVATEAVPQDDYEQMLKTRISSDDAPDVFVLDNQSRYQEFSAAKRLYDISELEGLDNMNPDMLLDGKVNGRQYAVPLDVNAYAVHYNRDMFEKYGLEVPTTVEEMKHVCAVLAENGIQPFATGYATQFCIWFGVEAFELPMCADADWFTDKMETKSTFSEDEDFKKAMEAWCSYQEYWGNDPWGTDVDTAQNQLANGEAAMMINGSWTVDAVSSINPDIHLGIFAMPAFEEKDSSVIIMKPGAGICLYNNESDAERLEASKKFFNYLLSEESGDSYAKNAFKISTLKNADVSFSEALMDATAYPSERIWNSAGVVQFTSEYEKAFYDILVKYAMKDSFDVDGLCRELDQNFLAIGK